MKKVESLFKKIVGIDPRRCEPKMSEAHMVRRMRDVLEERAENLFQVFDVEQQTTIHVEEYGVIGGEPYTLLGRSNGGNAFIFGLCTDGRDENLDELASSAHWF